MWKHVSLYSKGSVLYLCGLLAKYICMIHYAVVLVCTEKCVNDYADMSEYCCVLCGERVCCKYLLVFFGSSQCNSPASPL